jgi:hypothetical protein
MLKKINSRLILKTTFILPPLPPPRMRLTYRTNYFRILYGFMPTQQRSPDGLLTWYVNTCKPRNFKPNIYIAIILYCNILLHSSTYVDYFTVLCANTY